LRWFVKLHFHRITVVMACNQPPGFRERSKDNFFANKVSKQSEDWFFM